MKLTLKFSLGFAAFLLSAGLVHADPQTVTGKASGPVVAVFSGKPGVVQLVHGDRVVREENVVADYTAALVLGTPDDKAVWNGKDASVLAGGSDPLAVARQSLEGRSAPYLFVIQADGTLDVVKALPDGYDAGAGATAEE